MSHIRPGDHLAVRGADQVEGRVLRVARDDPLVDWGGRLGTVRNSWSEVGVRFMRLPRRAVGEGERRRRAGEFACSCSRPLLAMTSTATFVASVFRLS